jgi:carboxyl-terminal processing protease
MRKIFFRKITIFVSLIIIGVISAGFFITQESRDFRIAKNLDIFFSLFRELNLFYVDEVNPDKVIKTGIDNMLKSLDPYTVFYPESEADEFALMTTGKYGGIGSLVRQNGDYVVIVEVYKGFPADQAGIKAGDIIKKINGVSIIGLTTEYVSDRLKGNPGSEITVTVERNGLESDHPMKRERIAIPPVPYFGMMIQTQVIYVILIPAGSRQDVKKALDELKNRNAAQIFLDLRSNPGGLLTEAVEIVNLFVGPGNNVVSTKGKVKQFDEEFKTTRPAVDEDIPLAVLINRQSASAAEIVAGAFQDLDRAVIVGQRSYGKGLVQVTRPLSYNTQLKVTTAKYYIPSGRCIQALDFSNRNEDGSVGIIPDSLISEFKTKNGRTVKDGGGIRPDIEITPESLSQVATELYLRNFIFDFATSYYWNHPEIKSPSDFVFTDDDYNDFRNMLVSRNFNYNTVTETSVTRLIESAKREKYYDVHKELFDRLKTEIVHDLDHDMMIFKPEITELLEQEIISRYFYEEASVEWSLKNDEQVNEALKVLNDTERYSSLLIGTQGSVITASTDPAGQR